VLKQGSETHSSLRQSNLQLQNEALLMAAIWWGTRGTCPPTFLDGGDIICRVPPHIFLRQWGTKRRGWPSPQHEKFRANSVFRASSSSSKILNDKKYFNSLKNFRANLVFQGKRRLFKILNDKKYIFNTVNSGHTLFSGQAQVPQCYGMFHP